MTRTNISWLLLFAVTIVSPAADTPAWMNKPTTEWTQADAKQLLAASPWVGLAEFQNLPDKSPDQRRDSGDWDEAIGHGVGIAGTGILGSRRAAEAVKEAHDKPSPGMFVIRWESAGPVRAAEAKTGEGIVSSDPAGFYSIVLYDVPLPKGWNANRLKGLAILRRMNNSDIKPGRVEVIRNDDGMATVVYMFPRSEEISRRDKDIIFAAQLGHLFVTRYFHPSQMQFRGSPEL